MAMQNHTKTKKSAVLSTKHTFNFYTTCTLSANSSTASTTEFCRFVLLTVHTNLALLSLSASVNHRILIKIVEKWRQNCCWWSCLSLNMSFSQFSGELKHKISSRDSISSFLLVQHIGVDTSKVQNVVKDSYRPPSCTCLHRVLSCHLVSNVHTTLSFIVECNCFRFLFCCCVDHNRWVECAKNTNVLLLFALLNCQRCGLVVFVFYLEEFAGISALL